MEYAPDHPHARKGFVAQHRWVMEKVIGRYLLPTELIHHIDCDMQSNDPDNLVITSVREHNISHGSLEKCVKRLLQMGVLKFNKTTMEYEVIDETYTAP